MREWRTKNPIRATYNQLKQNAKRRDVPFELTLDDWKVFLTLHPEYLQKRGLNPDSASVDRLKAYDDKGFKLPYRLDNLQVLTLSENTLKANKERRTRKGWGIKITYLPGEEPPF